MIRVIAEFREKQPFFARPLFSSPPLWRRDSARRMVPIKAEEASDEKNLAGEVKEEPTEAACIKEVRECCY